MSDTNLEGRFSVTKVESMDDRGNGAAALAKSTSILLSPLREGQQLDAISPGVWGDPEGLARRKRSLAQMTREALPRLDNYRNSRRALKRPSLGELHGEIKERVRNLFLTNSVNVTLLF